MKTYKHLLSVAAAGFVMMSLAGSARADGIVLGTKNLKSKDRSALKSEISKRRASNPTIFAKVAQAPQMAIEMDEMKRGRAASITLALSGLGKEALFPMLEMLAVDGPPRGKMGDSAWTTLRVGLIEAVGLIRDPRAKPVLNAILDRETDFELVRASAEALGRIGDDASAKKLVRLASVSSVKQAPVLMALGECRRTVAAQALAKLVNTKDEGQLRVVLKSLGTVGNAWAWQTPDISKTGEGDQVRAIAAKAAMQAFVANTGYIQSRAQTALLIINDPSTPSLIAQAKQGASPELLAALDELATRVANNPAK